MSSSQAVFGKLISGTPLEIKRRTKDVCVFAQASRQTCEQKFKSTTTLIVHACLNKLQNSHTTK